LELETTLENGFSLKRWSKSTEKRESQNAFGPRGFGLRACRPNVLWSEDLESTHGFKTTTQASKNEKLASLDIWRHRCGIFSTLHPVVEKKFMHIFRTSAT
jgi:hypothetical protein